MFQVGDNKSDKSGSGRSDKGSNASKETKSSRENTPKKKGGSLPKLDMVAQRLATCGAEDSPAPSPNLYKVCPSSSTGSLDRMQNKSPKSPAAGVHHICKPKPAAPQHFVPPGAVGKVPPKTRAPAKPKRTKLDKSLVSPGTPRLKGIVEESTLSKEEIPLTRGENPPHSGTDRNIKRSGNGGGTEADVWL